MSVEVENRGHVEVRTQAEVENGGPLEVRTQAEVLPEKRKSDLAEWWGRNAQKVMQAGPTAANQGAYVWSPDYPGVTWVPDGRSQEPPSHLGREGT